MTSVSNNQSRESFKTILSLYVRNVNPARELAPFF